MRVFFDLLLVVITTLIAIRSIRLIASYNSKSLSDWAISLLFIFQSLPIYFDLIVGMPKYNAWFSGFAYAMADDRVCIIYDIYVITINCCLMFVSIKAQKAERQEYSRIINDFTSKIPDLVLYLLILSPAIHVLLSGNISSFLIYNSFDGRGLESSFIEVHSAIVIIAILALMVWYFRSDGSIPRLIWFIIFSFLIIWISGKRYSVVTILFSYLYMTVLVRRESRHRINIRSLLIIMGLAVVLYSVYYITTVRVTADSSFNSVYTALRIDFGRDDVVKYTIWKEYINKDHILEYPLQTVISTLFMIVPRTLFPGKGYPHYRYLTASLYNIDIMNIPSGMTPSVLEMMISNFRYLGIPICILFLCWYCKKADKAKTNLQYYCFAMVMMGMLTQSLDSMFILFYMVLYYVLFGNIRFTFGSR